MKEYTYHVLYDTDDQTPDDPAHVVRIEKESGYPQTLWGDGKWRLAATWMSIMRGDATYDALEITREKAMDVARRWRLRGELSRIPRDLRKP